MAEASPSPGGAAAMGARRGSIRQPMVKMMNTSINMAGSTGSDSRPVTTDGIMNRSRQDEEDDDGGYQHRATARDTAIQALRRSSLHAVGSNSDSRPTSSAGLQRASSLNGTLGVGGARRRSLAMDGSFRPMSRSAVGAGGDASFEGKRRRSLIGGPGDRPVSRSGGLDAMNQSMMRRPGGASMKDVTPVESDLSRSKKQAHAKASESDSNDEDDEEAQERKLRKEVKENRALAAISGRIGVDMAEDLDGSVTEAEVDHPDYPASHYRNICCNLLHVPRHAVPLKHSSLFLFSGSNPFRIWVYGLTHHKIFETFVILAILLNGVLLAMDDPTNPVSPDWVDQINLALVVIFTFEMVVKIISYGFLLHSGSYLRNHWNQLDFLIVVFAYLNFVPGFGNFTAFRVLRVLRPLRSMHAIPPLRLLVTILLKSVAGLANVMLLALFMVSIFAIVGSQLFQGALMYRCVDNHLLSLNGSTTVTQMYNGTNVTSVMLMNLTVNGTTGINVNLTDLNAGNPVNLAGLYCKPGGGPFYSGVLGLGCPDGSTCVKTGNPHYGYTSFDNVLFAFLIIMQVITQEAWSELMRNTMTAVSGFASIYFILLIFLGSYLVLQLALAVISAEFEFAQENFAQEDGAELQAEVRRLQLVTGTRAIQDEIRQHALALNLASAQFSPLIPGASGAKFPGAPPTGTVSPALGSKMPLIAVNHDRPWTTGSESAPTPNSKDPVMALTPPAPPFSSHSNDGSWSPAGAHQSFDNSAVIPMHPQPPQGELLAGANASSTSHTTATTNNNNNLFGGSTVNNLGGSMMALSVNRKEAIFTPGSNSNNSVIHINSMTHHLDIDAPPGAGNSFSIHSEAHGGSVGIASRRISLANVKRSSVEVWQEGGAPVDIMINDDGDIVDVQDEEHGCLYNCLVGPVGGLEDPNDQSWLTRARRVVYEFVEGPIPNSKGVPAAVVSGSGGSNDGEDEEMAALNKTRGDDQEEDPSSPTSPKTPRARDDAPVTTWFTRFIILCILVNTAFMAADHYGSTEYERFVFSTANVLFSAIFAAEMVIKLFALGPIRYVRDPFNCFDGAIVIISIVELSLGGNARFSVFRTFRLLRIFKLLKKVPSLLAIVNVLLYAVKDTAFLMVFLFLYLYIWSLVGMNFFGGKISWYNSENPYYRMTFDSFWKSFLLVFEILTRDNWPVHMIRAIDGTTYAAALYFILAVFIGDFVILNLFLSIIISSFDNIGKETAHENDMAAQLEAKAAEAAAKRQKKFLKSKAMTLSDGLNGKIGDFSQLQMQQTNIAGKVALSTSAATAVLDGDSKLHNMAMEQAETKTSNSGFEGAAAMSVVRLPALKVKKLSAPSSDNDNNNAAGGSNPLLGAPDTPAAAKKSVKLPEADEDDSAPGLPIGSMQQLVAAMKAANQSTVGTKIAGMCPRCGDPIMVPFPTPSKNIRPPAPEDLHERMCDKIQVRKAKERAIQTLLQEISNRQERSRRHIGRDVPTARDVEDIFGRAWEVGLLLGEDVGSQMINPGWDRLAHALLEERAVVDLRVGEDQIGGALISYTSANIPTEFTTNGGTSLWIFGKRNGIRIACTQFVFHPWFERFILLCILASSILLAVDDPRLPDDDPKSVAITNAGNFFTAVFTLEMCMKIIALGFVLYPTAYLRDPWNMLDCFTVIVSLVSLGLTGSVDISFLKVLRTFRAIRPLRVISKDRGLKMVVITLIESMKGIANVAMITLLVYLVFAILGTTLFGGKLASCNDVFGMVPNKQACQGWFFYGTSFNSDSPPSDIDLIQRLIQWNQDVMVENSTTNGIIMATVNTAPPHLFPWNWTSIVSKYVVSQDLANNLTSLNALGDVWGAGFSSSYLDVLSSVNMTRKWASDRWNFDNTYNSFLLLLTVATLDDWGTKMYRTMDLVDVDVTPIVNYSEYNAVYFIVFIIVGSFFLLSMFVGVVIFQYNETKDGLDGVSLLTPEQKHWVETQRMVLNYRPVRRNIPPTQSWRRVLFDAVTSTYWELGIGMLVLLNIVFIAMDYYDAPAQWTYMLTVANYVFVAIFAVEALIKNVALGWQYYLDGWNRLDFILVVISILTSSIDVLPNLPTNTLRILRVIRLARLLSLVNRAKRLRVLIETLYYSLPSLINVSMFLILLFFIYAVLGVQLFAQCKVRDSIDSEWANFSTFITSFLLLVRIVTFDDVGNLMWSVSRTDDCTAKDCGTAFAPLYFISFMVLGAYVMMNVIVAVILDNFNTTMRVDHSEIKVADLKKFAEEWSRYDPEATMILDTRYFPRLLLALKPPLGVPRRGDRLALLQIAEEMNIPEHGGLIHFVETLIPLARRVQQVRFEERDIRDHEDGWKESLAQITDLPVLRYRQKRVGVEHYLGATYIAGAYRRTVASREYFRRYRAKIQEVNAWYEKQGIPLAERTAVHRLKEAFDKKPIPPGWEKYIFSGDDHRHLSLETLLFGNATPSHATLHPPQPGTRPPPPFAAAAAATAKPPALMHLASMSSLSTIAS